MVSSGGACGDGGPGKGIVAEKQAQGALRVCVCALRLGLLANQVASRGEVRTGRDRCVRVRVRGG